MAAFTLEIPVHTSDIVSVTITETASLVEPQAGNVAVYGSDITADEVPNAHRKGERVADWRSLFRGWKSHAYEPFGPSVGSNDYLWIPIDNPYIPARKIAQDFALLTTDASTISILGIGIDEKFVGKGRGVYTLLLRNAFDALQNYY
jgi:hypothetical protein